MKGFPMPTALEGAHLYEQVADRLEQQILSHPDTVGTKLPSEQELAHGFSVSRPVVREALKLLKERQLVTVRNGEGVFVEKPGAQSLAKMLSRVMTMERVDPRQVYELRLILEPAACQMAAERVTQEDLDALRALLEDTQRDKADHAARVENDFAFHLAIANLSGNRLIAYILTAIKDLFCALIEPAVLSPQGSARGIQFHGRIIEALASGDGEAARETMRTHLTACKGDYKLSPKKTKI
jgi:DNA-binding FadR family transcriptional regulator